MIANYAKEKKLVVIYDSLIIDFMMKLLQYWLHKIW